MKRHPTIRVEMTGRLRKADKSSGEEIVAGRMAGHFRRHFGDRSADEGKVLTHQSILFGCGGHIRCIIGHADSIKNRTAEQ
jgi:hypothetical protein